MRGQLYYQKHKEIALNHHNRSVSLRAYKWNQMDPYGSVWFHLYTLRVMVVLKHLRTTSTSGLIMCHSVVVNQCQNILKKTWRLDIQSYGSYDQNKNIIMVCETENKKFTMDSLCHGHICPCRDIMMTPALVPQE